MKALSHNRSMTFIGCGSSVKHVRVVGLDSDSCLCLTYVIITFFPVLFFGGSHLCLGTNCFDHLLKTLFLTSFRDRAIELDINTSEIIKLTVDKWIDH